MPHTTSRPYPIKGNALIKPYMHWNDKKEFVSLLSFLPTGIIIHDSVAKYQIQERPPSNTIINKDGAPTIFNLLSSIWLFPGATAIILGSDGGDAVPDTVHLHRRSSHEATMETQGISIGVALPEEPNTNPIYLYQFRIDVKSPATYHA